MLIFSWSQTRYNNDIIAETFKSELFLHAILAISAIHMAHENSSKVEQCRAAALTHYNHALRSLRHHVVAVTPENCHIVFVCSFLVFQSALALPIVHNDTNRTLDGNNNGRSSSTFGHFLEWLSLLRGIVTILLPIQSCIATGPFRILIEPNSPGVLPCDDALQDAFDAHLGEFQTFLHSHTSTPHQICLAATKDLATELAAIRGHPEDFGIAFQWLATRSADFVGTVEARAPEALVVLAYFCVLLHRTEQRWWFERWRQDLIYIIEASIESNMLYWIEWPLDIIGGGRAGVAKGHQ